MFSRRTLLARFGLGWLFGKVGRLPAANHWRTWRLDIRSIICNTEPLSQPISIPFGIIPNKLIVGPRYKLSTTQLVRHAHALAADRVIPYRVIRSKAARRADLSNALERRNETHTS